MNRKLLSAALIATVLFSAAMLLLPALAQAPAPPEKPKATSLSQAYQELFDLSMKEKKGLTLYVGGQAIGGGVTRVIGNEAVEMKSQEFSKIVVRIDRIDGIAVH